MKVVGIVDGFVDVWLFELCCEQNMMLNSSAKSPGDP